MYRVAMAAVVTTSMLNEFQLMKFSFELFHADIHQWFVRSDWASARALASCANVTCTVFTDQDFGERVHILAPHFRQIAQQKMYAISDAWSAAQWDAVVYVDADILFTQTFIEKLLNRQDDVQLAPNYFPTHSKYRDPKGGYFNSGFVLCRSKEFASYWLSHFALIGSSWSDQLSLNELPEHFRVGELEESANIGFWRSSDSSIFLPIPVDCMFLHVHLFQLMRTRREILDRAFGLHCVKFLAGSPNHKHTILFEEILRRDNIGWYRVSLNLL
jgi:hypothetical protein